MFSIHKTQKATNWPCFIFIIKTNIFMNARPGPVPKLNECTFSDFAVPKDAIGVPLHSCISLRTVWFIYCCKTWNKPNCYFYETYYNISRCNSFLVYVRLTRDTCTPCCIFILNFSLRMCNALKRSAILKTNKTHFFFLLVGYRSSIRLWTRSLGRSWRAAETTLVELFSPPGLIGNAIIRSSGAG